jgi:hypothetical protein
VGLVWANCRAFNAEGSPVTLMADAAESAFQASWSRQGLPPLASSPGRAADRADRVTDAGIPHAGECEIYLAQGSCTVRWMSRQLVMLLTLLTRTQHVSSQADRAFQAAHKGGVYPA